MIFLLVYCLQNTVRWKKRCTEVTKPVSDAHKESQKRSQYEGQYFVTTYPRNGQCCSVIKPVGFSNKQTDKHIIHIDKQTNKQKTNWKSKSKQTNKTSKLLQHWTSQACSNWSRACYQGVRYPLGINAEYHLVPMPFRIWFHFMLTVARNWSSDADYVARVSYCTA